MKLGASNNVITEVAMPLELRQAMQRYPVTLYTTGTCQPCDSGRQLLKQRGIPFSEKLVISGEDGDELLRLSGSRDAPTLTIGAQVLRGFAGDAWASYLDAAGYPRESRLPATYQYPTPTPLVPPPQAPAAREATPAQPVAQPQQRPPAEPSSSGIRF